MGASGKRIRGRSSIEPEKCPRTGIQTAFRAIAVTWADSRRSKAAGVTLCNYEAIYAVITVAGLPP